MRPSIARLLLRSLAALALAHTASVRADVVVGGTGNFNFDQAAWASLAGGANIPGFEALQLGQVFDQAQANARTGAQLLTDVINPTPSYGGITFAVNGPSVSNLAGRNTQPTNFSFDSANLTAATGAIGLGGVTRWTANPLLGGGSLLFGDFTLSYDATRQLVGGSGWELKGNIAPAAVVFDLLNVHTSASGNTLSISGDLGISYEVANFLFATPGDQGKDVGTFSLTATTAVPEPAAYTVVAGLACLLLAARRLRPTAG
jgi:hypothetical protein